MLGLSWLEKTAKHTNKIWNIWVQPKGGPYACAIYSSRYGTVLGSGLARGSHRLLTRPLTVLGKAFLEENIPDVHSVDMQL